MYSGLFPVFSPSGGDMFIARRVPKSLKAAAGRYVYHVSVSSSASKTYLGLYGTSKGSKGFSIAIARLWRNGTSSQLQTYRESKSPYLGGVLKAW